MHECAISRNENHLEDLISKKSLIATIEKEAGMNIPEWLRDTIMNAQSAVVRCRDCKYWQLGTENLNCPNPMICSLHSFMHGFERASLPEDYCSWAKGRANE